MDRSPQLDETDREIVRLLEQDSRRTLADIGGRVSLSAPAVRRRIDRLERAGVITGYTIEVDHKLLGRPLEAFAELRFVGSSPVDEITATTGGVPEVEMVFTTAGDPDALVWLRVRDVEHLQQVIDRLRRSGRVTGTKTMMVLSRWDRRATAARRTPG